MVAGRVGVLAIVSVEGRSCSRKFIGPYVVHTASPVPVALYLRMST